MLSKRSEFSEGKESDMVSKAGNTGYCREYNRGTREGVIGSVWTRM